MEGLEDELARRFVVQVELVKGEWVELALQLSLLAKGVLPSGDRVRAEIEGQLLSSGESS